MEGWKCIPLTNHDIAMSLEMLLRAYARQVFVLIAIIAKGFVPFVMIVSSPLTKDKISWAIYSEQELGLLDINWLAESSMEKTLRIIITRSASTTSC